ncbi:MAG: ABC transporter permease subunit [Bacteriovoracia bacterium]
MRPEPVTPYGVPILVRRRVKNSLVYLILITLIMAVSMGLYQGGLRLAELKAEQITLSELPGALLLSFLRMLASYGLCLILAFATGLLAATNRTAERVIIPLLDILQSVPVVGFFPAVIAVFIGFTQGHRLGVELAAIFLILTSQAWNIAFAVYESVKSIPQDNLDAVRSFGVSGPHRFWLLYAPACVPRLIYNSILSWSNGWFFLVACEIIAVGSLKYHLPGIGSFLAMAAENDQVGLILWGLAALTALILTLDFLVWRPLSYWADRFKQDYSASGADTGLSRSTAFTRKLVSQVRPLKQPLKKLLRALFFPLTWIVSQIVAPLLWDLPRAVGRIALADLSRRFPAPATASELPATAGRRKLAREIAFWGLLVLAGFWAGMSIVQWLQPPYPPLIFDIPYAILASTGRLLIAVALSMLWVLPVVLFTWNRPRLRQWLTTISQVGASLPAIALFPLIVLFAVRKLGGGMEVASIILLLSGMQWYILFNGLSGAAIIPGDIADAARSLGLTRWQTWRRLVLPAIRPALVTGTITAWGGGWNALVVSEYLTFKNEVLQVKGLGALLNYSVYQLGDARSITICIGAMVGWIILINTFFWQPVYRRAIERFRFEA